MCSKLATEIDGKRFLELDLVPPAVLKLWRLALVVLVVEPSKRAALPAAEVDALKPPVMDDGADVRRRFVLVCLCTGIDVRFAGHVVVRRFDADRDLNVEPGAVVAVLDGGTPVPKCHLAGEPEDGAIIAHTVADAFDGAPLYLFHLQSFICFTSLASPRP
jgi:hypothetical protein